MGFGMGGRRRSGVLAVAAGAAVGACASGAHATWSILIADTRTGEIAVGSATCVTGIDLRDSTPVIVTGVGAATAQSAVDASGLNRIFVRDGFISGQTPAEILAGLEAFDGGHQTRQYGIVDVLGNAVTFSGASASQWKGGVTGRIERGRPGPEDDLVYAVQGNILVDAPVVLRAELAILQTPGDLAAKLMAGMEAARFWGGDGRCSCAQGDPTGCDTPPPAPFKSAHIGYMLVSRPGDRDDCPSLYSLGNTPSALVAIHLDDDGVLDVVGAPSSGPLITPLINTTAPGSDFLTLDPGERFEAGGSSVTGLARGDVTGDGVEDLVAVMQIPDQLTVLEGEMTPGGLVFSVAQTIPLGSDPEGVVVGDFDGQFGMDVAATVRSGDEVAVALSDGAGGLGAPVTIAMPGRPQGIASADLDNDGDADLAVTLTTGDAVAILTNNGAGAFSHASTVAIGDDPVRVRAAHLNGDVDDDIDLVVANRLGTSITTLVREGAGYIAVEHPLAVGRGADVIATDADTDGDTDILALGAFGRVEVFAGDGTGAFVSAQTADLGDSAPITALALDLSQDGTPDLLTGGNQRRSLKLITNVGGVFSETEGCAGGSYFMELNTGPRGRFGPEPVLFLRDRYDEWGEALVGRPDGVVSKAPREVRVVEGHTARARVELRDREGTSVGGPVVLDALAPGGSAGVDAIADLGGSAFEITVSGVTPGAGELEIVADDGGRLVRLIPEPRVVVIDARADLTGDGTASVDDIGAFVQAFMASEASADIDGDGFFTPADIDLFVELFIGE